MLKDLVDEKNEITANINALEAQITARLRGLNKLIDDLNR